MVELRIRSQFEDVECVIEAITIPVICQDIAAITTDMTFVQEIPASKRKLAGDVVFVRVKAEPGIGLLIGSD